MRSQLVKIEPGTNLINIHVYEHAYTEINASI